MSDDIKNLNDKLDALFQGAQVVGQGEKTPLAKSVGDEVSLLPTSSLSELEALLADKGWRMENLYYILDKGGNKVLFKMNSEQLILFNEMHYLCIIPKARQLGMTTFFCIYYLDEIVFSAYKTAGIIAHKKEDGKKIFANKIKFAWDNMPKWVKDTIGEPTTDTAQELTFPHGSTIFVSTSTRGGTLNYLHVSEFGYICTHYPEKAEEIVTGSMNSVQAGQMISIESTSKGKGGYFNTFCETAKRMQDEKRVLSELDFKLFFFPWWKNPEYRLDNSDATINDAMAAYFDELKFKYGVDLDIAQKRWYIKKKEKNLDRMFNEYPSTFEECFKGSVDGAYYSSQMSKVYEDKRIRNVPWDSLLEVQTWWDLGMNDTNTIIFTQSFGNEIRVIDYYENSGEGLDHYYKILKDKGYTYEFHYLPHDVEMRELGTGVSRKETMQAIGFQNIRVGKKIGILEGIEKARNVFSRVYFDEAKSEKLYTALQNYRKEWDDEVGVYKDKPVHDKYSHAADAFRLLGINWREDGMFGSSSSGQSTEQNFFAGSPL
jgi:hypothetical protein